MIGGKKTWKKKQINLIRPTILGAKFQGKTAFPLPPATDMQEKRESPHSRMDFGGKMKFSWILSNWNEFSWNSHSKEASLWRCQDFFGVFFGNICGMPGNSRGVELRKCCSGKREPPENGIGTYGSQGFIQAFRTRGEFLGKAGKGGFGAVFLGGFFFHRKERKEQGKGGEKAKFSSRFTSSNSQDFLVPSSWNCQKNSGKENSTGFSSRMGSKRSRS